MVSLQKKCLHWIKKWDYREHPNTGRIGIRTSNGSVTEWSVHSHKMVQLSQVFRMFFSRRPPKWTILAILFNHCPGLRSCLENQTGFDNFIAMNRSGS
jgi:hypothetical protein